MAAKLGTMGEFGTPLGFDVGGPDHGDPCPRRHREPGSSTTPPATRTPCTSTRPCSRSSNREGLAETINEESRAGDVLPDGNVTLPEPWEAGFKDTVTAYPGQVTRVKATFTNAGQYVWHCHIVSHEDNEMMRPFRIGPEQPGQPKPKGRSPGR